jgi:Holliday junction DNA helicase RuvA
VELRDKLAPRKGVPFAADLAAAPVPEDPVEEAVEALVALGYGRVEAAAAVQRARKELGEDAGVSELLKAGLKRL